VAVRMMEWLLGVVRSVVETQMGDPLSVAHLIASPAERDN
jgi:hypothetical protein